MNRGVPRATRPHWLRISTRASTRFRGDHSSWRYTAYYSDGRRTTHMTLARPQAGEFAPYAEKYISLVPDDVLGALAQQARQTMHLFADRPESDGDFRYAPDKWSAKEVLGHIIDTERIFTYRALRAARRDRT